MKQKEMYINRYNFYAYNCWLILCLVISLIVYGSFIINLSTASAVSIGIIGGADGPTSIYVASRLTFIPLLIILSGVISIWIILFIRYRHHKDAIKSISLQSSILFTCVMTMLIIVTANWILGILTLSLGIILMFLWGSKKFEVHNKEEVK